MFISSFSLKGLTKSLCVSLSVAFFSHTSGSGAFVVPPTVENPVIVIAPAAWHSPVHYKYYMHELQLAGFETDSERLPSCDSNNPYDKSVKNDAEFIRAKLLMPFINAGKEVVLVVHSYSGGPGGMAARGLSVAERQPAGQTGGIIGLIFISAFVAHEGQSLLSASGGKFSPWVIEYTDGQLGVRNPEAVFYNDVPHPLSDEAAAELRNQSRHSAETLCGPPAWSEKAYTKRLAYVHTTLDRAIPFAAQQLLVNQSGVQWDIGTFVSGHAPFLSHPKELSLFTRKEITKFKALGKRKIGTYSFANISWHGKGPGIAKM